MSIAKQKKIRRISADLEWGSATATVVVTALDVGITARHTGRAKFTHGESHMTEHGAGIVLTGLDTFLIGDTILGCLDEILSGTNDTNDREDAQ